MEARDPDLLWLLGKDADERGDRGMALRYWRRAAELGNVDAAVQGGLVLEEADPAEAAVWYQRATSERRCFSGGTAAELAAVQLAHARLRRLASARRPPAAT